MKKYIPHIITLAAITGFLAIAPNTTHAQTSDSLLTDSVDQSVLDWNLLSVGEKDVRPPFASLAVLRQGVKKQTPRTG
jgi:hypothetical protein